MQILKIEDPRDNLSKASRYELCQLAKAHGVAEISYGCSLQLPEIVELLHKRGIHDIKIPDRPLGVYAPVVINAENVETPALIDHPQPEPAAKPVSEMNMTEMRKEAKRRGIKMARTDNLRTLRTKLSG